MKICAIICEFNPFHNGHKYLLDEVRRLSGCDTVLCLMSGSFTQRGEICCIDKYLRAHHAVLGGADCVLELPAAFTVVPAEIFAKGAIKILSQITQITTLAFGCENADKDSFIKTANFLINESNEFKTDLQQNLNEGKSYIKSLNSALKKVGGDTEILSKPNNILGLEYTKAILKSKCNLDILPIKRIGANYKDDKIQNNFSSAGAIRQNISSPLIKDNVPKYVFSDLTEIDTKNATFKQFVELILTRSKAEDIAKVYGCSEGLENKLKKLEHLDYDKIVNSATTIRYSSSRIKRILCANFLKIYQDDCKTYLNSTLYLKPLAIKQLLADGILSELSQSDYPLIISGQDKLKLNETALKCLEQDEFCYSQWQKIAQSVSKNNNKLVLV